MEERETILRVARLEDAEAILQIYAPYVRDTAITFEYEVPDLVQFQERMKKTMKKYPYLVAEQGGELLGYGYLGPFVGRAAYDWSAETTIYLRQDCRKQGLGRRLYEALEAAAKAQNILNLNACIGYPEVEDAYLTKNSAQFHQHLGYVMAGRFHGSGYKFGTWYDMVWMEKQIGVHTSSPSPVIPFPELSEDALHQILKGQGSLVH